MLLFPRIFLSIAISLSVAVLCHAQLVIPDVVKTANQKRSLALGGIRTDNSTEAKLFVNVLKDNLKRSGWFLVDDTAQGSVRVSGTVTGGQECTANITVFHGNSQRFDWRQSCRTSADEVRPMAHALNDEIIRRVLNKKGMASAPIIMVGKRGNATDIYMCDADGGRLKRLTNDERLCLSPKWLPDRSGFLYTSYLKGGPATYRVNFGAGGGMKREVLTALPGLNTGAAVSPDGRDAAMILSASGNVELYIMNLSSKALTRLTFTRNASEASPCWSPSGGQIAYVSDVTRSPQIYTIGRNQREGKRAITGFSESVAPDWGPDGRIAFCGRPSGGGTYGVYVAETGKKSVIVSPVDGNRYEDPSWAPDGRHIVCTRTAGGRRTLVVLDTMGDPPVQLLTTEGQWYLPDWSR